MIVEKFDSKEAWRNGRLGCVTGSRLKDILPGRSGAIKKGRWELVAERLIGSAALNDEENAMARGTRLEQPAIERFAKETGKNVVWCDDDTIWRREDDKSISISPDGYIGKTQAVEVKCLNAASHIEARVTGKIPTNTAGYEEQAVQYFCVNDKLKTLYFVFYDPRFPVGLDFFYLTISRADVEEKVVEYLKEQREALKWVRDTVNTLTLYSPEEIQKSEEVRTELAIATSEDHKTALDRVHAGIMDRMV